MTNLNDRAWAIADEIEADATVLRIAVSTVGSARIIDCGVAAVGGLRAGRLLARACLADLAEVNLVTGHTGANISVSTDAPVLACLGSQYAGWHVQAGKFFAMGSGPMRALSGREEVLKHLNISEDSTCAVGVLESRKLPTEEVVASIREKLPATVNRLTLLVAPASSIAGTIQVVARSVETALHKLHELKFDVNCIASAFGVAPLPPVANDELAAIGRTNDAILYGGSVTLWMKCDDAIIDEIGPKVPSNASADHGELFADLFKRYGDFYKIDPLLFSPAEVTFVNLQTGRAKSFGSTDAALLKKSFFGE
jgi:methenyltetrahydromethanopterin cyclohydrolase